MMDSEQKFSITQMPMTLLLIVAVTGTAVSGCLGASDDAVDENLVGSCEFYPDRDYLRETWDSLANRTDLYGAEAAEGPDQAVGMAMAHWLEDHEDGGLPPTYVVWEEYPEDSRPQIMQDLLCFAEWRIQEHPHLASQHGFWSSTSTAQYVAQEALDDLAAEHYRQTGVWKEWRESDNWTEACCFVLFEEKFFMAGCEGYHGTYEWGSITTSCVD